MFRLEPVQRIHPEDPDYGDGAPRLPADPDAKIPVPEVLRPPPTALGASPDVVEDGWAKDEGSGMKAAPTTDPTLNERWRAMSSARRCMAVACCVATFLVIAGGIATACILVSESDSSSSNATTTSTSGASGSAASTTTTTTDNPLVPVTAASLTANGCTATLTDNKLSSLAEACNIITNDPTTNNRVPAINAWCADNDPTTEAWGTDTVNAHKGGFAAVTMIYDACIGNGIVKPFTASSTTIEFVDAITTHLSTGSTGTLVSSGTLTPAQLDVYTVCNLMIFQSWTPSQVRDPNFRPNINDGTGSTVSWNAYAGMYLCKLPQNSITAGSISDNTVSVSLSSFFNTVCPIVYTVQDGAKCCDPATCTFTKADGSVLATAHVLTGATQTACDDGTWSCDRRQGKTEGYTEEQKREFRQKEGLVTNLMRMKKMATIAQHYFPENVRKIHSEGPGKQGWVPMLRFFGDSALNVDKDGSPSFTLMAAIYGLKFFAKLGVLSPEHQNLAAEL